MAHLITKIAEYAIILDENNKFLMLKFSKETNSSEGWIFPGGRLDIEDNPKQGLVREIKEETGLEVEVLFPCDVTMWGLDDDQRYAVFFVCRLKGSSEVKLSNEHQDSNWFSFDKLEEINFHDKSFRTVLLNTLKLVNNYNS
jgi:8-oxo-dGTP diphosphatase